MKLEPRSPEGSLGRDKAATGSGEEERGKTLERTGCGNDELGWRRGLGRDPGL